MVHRTPARRKGAWPGCRCLARRLEAGLGVGHETANWAAYMRSAVRAAGPGGDRVREQLVSVASIKLSACYARFLRAFINARAGVHVEGSWRCLLGGVQTRFREMGMPLGM